MMAPVMSLMRFAFILLAVLVLASPASAEPVRRAILAVVDGSETHGMVSASAARKTSAHALRDKTVVLEGGEDLSGTFNAIAKFAETPLNHLGFIVEHVDVSQRLPDDKEMEQYAGVISWFGDRRLRGATRYAAWITRQLTRGKKLVVLNELGFEEDEKGNPTPPETMEAFKRAFGISFVRGEGTDSPMLIEVLSNDPAMTEFERTLTGELTSFEKLSATDPSSRVFLRLKRKDTGSTCDAVFTSAKGGMALGDYVLFVHREFATFRWRINPFRFFAAAFGADFPAPDITTQNGVRLFMSHIDGDGIRNVSSIDGHSNSGTLLYDQVLTKYRLPVTASVIIGDLIDAGDDRKAIEDLTRRIFALPNVEPASHGWAHPFVWDAERRRMAFALEGYTYSPENEIGRSIAYIRDRLAPPEKKNILYLWTGDCRPDAEALAYVRQHGIGAINGGDTRMDKVRPSYAYVAPFFRHEKGQRQEYAVDSNEFIFTNGWTGPFYGFRYVIDTYERTESPIRIRPVDVYYHYYIMDRPAAAASLHDVYRWAERQELAFQFVSEYLNRLDGFLSTRIERTGDNRWIISQNGTLRTIRLDGYDGFVDLRQSNGILGFLSHQGSLYVHLDNGKRSEIVVTRERPTTPYLMKANGEVADFLTGRGKVSFRLRTMGRAIVALGGLETGRSYRLTIGGETQRITADKQGAIAASREIPEKGFAWLDVAAVPE